MPTNHLGLFQPLCKWSTWRPVWCDSCTPIVHTAKRQDSDPTERALTHNPPAEHSHRDWAVPARLQRHPTNQSYSLLLNSHFTPVTFQCMVPLPGLTAPTPEGSVWGPPSPLHALQPPLLPQDCEISPGPPVPHPWSSLHTAGGRSRLAGCRPEGLTAETGSECAGRVLRHFPVFTSHILTLSSN